MGGGFDAVAEKIWGNGLWWIADDAAGNGDG